MSEYSKSQLAKSKQKQFSLPTKNGRNTAIEAKNTVEMWITWQNMATLST